MEGILVSFEIMGLFLLLQIMVSFVGASAVMAAYMLQTGADVESAQYAALNVMMDSRYMTTLTVVATMVSAVVSVPAYWLIWGRKKTAEDRRC